MNETARLALPLLAPSQAQKHVTVNEALLRLDALSQLVLTSISEPTPPGTPAEGQVFGVPAEAVNAWAGQEGRLAIAQAGGWVFADPAPGWRGYIADAGVFAVWSGAVWTPVGLGAAPSGAGTVIRSVEIDHAVAPGAVSTTVPVIPEGAIVFAVTGRVVAEITGGATSFMLGVAGAPNRYGSGIGVSAGAWLRGVTGAPQAYYADTALELTAADGAFAGGTVRLAVHLAEFSLPAA